MSALTAGTAVVLRTAQGRPLRVRVLGSAELSGDWSAPVMVPAAASGVVRGVLELAGPLGLLRVDAELVQDGAGAVLRAPATAEAGAGRPDSSRQVSAREALLVQRRSHVRAPVRLTVRAIVLDGTGTDGDQELSGHSTDLSGAGLALAWDEGSRPRPPEASQRLYLELSLPLGDPVAAVVEVVASSREGVQARFVDLAPIDRERLIALVFQVQRRYLARRNAERRPVPTP